MRSLLLCSLALFLVAPDAHAQRPNGQRGGGRGGRGEVRLRELELHHFDAERVTIDAPSLRAGKLECVAYVPKSLAPATTAPADDAAATPKPAPTDVPWVLWLHGLNDGFHRFHNDGGAATLDALRGEDAIPDMVVVVPTVARQTLYIDGESNGDVEKALLEDVPAFVAKTWPMVSKNPAKHAIMGVSMGGYAALKIALRHPEQFGVVAAHASAILPADPDELPEQFSGMRGRMAQMLGIDEVFGDPIDKAKWAAHMPLALVAAAEPKSFAKLAIYFDVGTEDRYGFAEPNGELDSAMTAKEIAHTFRLVEGGGHSWGSPSMTENLEQSFRFVATALTAPPAKEQAAVTKTADPAPASGGK